MRFASKRICINPPFPIKQSGHITQVDEITEVHDDLEARLLYLENDSMIWLSVSLDNIGTETDYREALEKELVEYYNKKIVVTVSSTHSHYCPDTSNKRYFDFLYSKIIEGAKSLEIKEVGELYTTYQSVYFDEVGKSRISHHVSDSVHLDLIQIKTVDKLLAEIVIHNVHPTILHANVPYFSAEYPGYVLNQLNEYEPEVFHTFLQGAAGDNSSRFTRTSQDYAAVKALGEKLFRKILELKNNEVKETLINLSFKSKWMPLNHEFQPVDLGEIPSDLSERELLTIEYGKIMRQQLKDNPDKLKDKVYFSCVDLSGAKIIFVPNECFSFWRTQVELSCCALCCYTNGYSSYMTGPDQHLLTYETFTDTVTRESKLNIVKLLNDWGKQKN